MTTLDVSEITDLIAQHGPFMLTMTGAIPTGDPTYNEWADAVTWAQNVEKSSPFWVGDLLAYGDRYGELASQVLEATEYAEQTCKNAKHVCQTIPPDRRNPNLSFSHHQEVSFLPSPAEQDAWLQKAEVEGLNREQLRIQIKAAKGIEAGQPVELWVMVRCETVEQQTQLADRMRLEGHAVKIIAKDSK